MKHCIAAPEILLPVPSVDLSAWAVIACDQRTSDSKYWSELDKYVGDRPSTLRLTLPEIYLDESEERVRSICANVRDYRARGLFRKLPRGFVLVKRTTPFSPVRYGIVLAVDLEAYSYDKKSDALIRATEATILGRIPPRLKIREAVDVEFPHIMLLYDDETRSVNEALYENRNRYEKIYDFELNMGGGHTEGYFISDCEEILSRFAAFADAERSLKKYGDSAPFLFAAGDGNHSLATAKEHWNRIKGSLSEKERATHPARYCLAEIVNVYDEGIHFEPIHRFVSGVDKTAFEKGLLQLENASFFLADGGVHEGKDSLPASIAAVDRYIEDYLKKHGGKVDYVHGTENLRALVGKDKTSSGICFKPMEKSELFAYVSKHGALPKKTFSMGEGVEKRYYLEGKLIR